MSISDFDDDDFADILEDEPVKLRRNSVTTHIIDNVDEIVKKEPETFRPKEKFSNNLKNEKLFDDEIDFLPSTNPTKIKETKTRPAKSILDSLLNPSKDLNDMDLSFSKLKSSNGKSDSIEENKDLFSQKIENRPTTSTGHQKDNTINQINKKNVRFSSEALIDGDLEFDYPIRNRPVTAPNSSTTDTAKPKYFNRFEAAEMDENPIKIIESIPFNNGSDSSLWRQSKSDEFSSSTGIGQKQINDLNEINKVDTNRNTSKQILNDFMQSNEVEISSLPTEKQRSPIFFDNTPKRSSNNSRRSSIEDLLDTRPKSAIVDELNFGRRASVSKEISLERPKTGHHRFENSQTKSDRSYPTEILHNDYTDYQLKIKHLEAERDELLYKLNKMSQRNLEELEMNEKLYKNRIEILEENMKSKENRLKEEIDLLSEQNKQKLQMLEQERLEMRSELTRRQDEIENQKRQEISRIREQHKCELEKFKLDYENMVDKLKQARTDEESTIRMAQPTTAQLQSVLTQVTNGTQDLVTIKQQLMEQFNRQIKEKDIQLKEQNDYLQLLKEKLDMQKNENIKEREHLQSLISKLEIQLTEQIRSADEERWFLRQGQNKQSALQSSLDKEREMILLEKDQNRASLEEFRKQILEEQKKMLEQIFEEKRNMAEERSKLTREMCKWSESSQLSTVKKNQEMAELEGIRSALTDERRELERIRTQLNTEREEIMSKSSKFDSMNYEIQMKLEKINNTEKELSMKQKSMSAKEEYCRDIEIRSEEALQQAKQLHSEHQNDISKIQKQLIVLNEKEQYVNKQMMELEKHRSNIQNNESSMFCNKCSNSFTTTAIGGSYNNLNKLSLNGFSRKESDSRIPNRLIMSMDQEIKNTLDYSSIIASQMEEERLIHSIKIAADDDREFLSQERAYLDSLVTTSQPSWKTHVRS